jgi:hypothetical protein
MRISFSLGGDALSSAFDQLDFSPLYCRTPNRLLIDKIVVLLQDIRSAISGADNSVDERR